MHTNDKSQVWQTKPRDKNSSIFCFITDCPLIDK